MHLKSISLFFFLLTTIGFVNGQETNKVSFLADVEQQMINSFTNKLINHNTIYNGKMYIPNTKPNDGGHPMFISNKYVDGYVCINQFKYSHVNLQYNLLEDQIILLNHDQVGGVILSIDDVQEFSLHNHQFVYIKPNSNQQDMISTGYYNQLHKGLNFTLFAKRTKKISEITIETGVKRSFIQQNKYYLFKNNYYHLVKTKKDLLTILDGKKELLLKYAKTNKLNFRNNQERAIYEMVKYFDTLN